MSKLYFNGKQYGPFKSSVIKKDILELCFDDPKSILGLEKELYSILPKKWGYEEKNQGSSGYALLESISRNKIILKLKDKPRSSAVKVNYENGLFKIHVKDLYFELNEKEAHNLGMEILSGFTIMSKVNNPAGIAH